MQMGASACRSAPEAFVVLVNPREAEMTPSSRIAMVVAALANLNPIVRTDFFGWFAQSSDREAAD